MQMMLQVLRGFRPTGAGGVDGKGTCGRRFQPHLGTTEVSELSVNQMSPERAGGSGGDSRLIAVAGGGTFVSSGYKKHQCPWSPDCAEVCRDFVETVNGGKGKAVGGADKLTRL